VRVLVSHPHAAAVANAVARALDERGALAGYATGVAAASGSWRARLLDAAARIRPELRNRAVHVGRDRLQARWSVEAMARVVARTGLVRGDRAVYDALFSMHDAVLAALTWPAGVDAVYAYEDASLRTFRKARSRGIARIWDLPIPHWATLDMMWREESVRWPGAMGPSPPVEPQWKRARKDEELALADVVSVASRFTRESLEAVGVTKPIVTTPYGFPAASFRPKDGPPDGSFTVLAVGTQDLRKGTPYLLEAWRRADVRDARLRLIGSMQLAESWLAERGATFEHVPSVPRALLEAEYRAADLLAFPTLGDGFGLVIQEAMCCGTPVLTTPCGGGPECIGDGIEGWIVPPRDVDALVERLRWAAANRDRLAEMGRAARRRAERYDERAAGEALVGALGRALGAGGDQGAVPGQPDRASTSS
jgi:hypothetical protein